jgi:hypothetical protein
MLRMEAPSSSSTSFRSPADARLIRAKARLDGLDWYPHPVDTRRVRIVLAPWFFRIPTMGRFDGYALRRTILLRRADASDELVTHELCHIWQQQHRPFRMPLTYLFGYATNPYELQARRAATLTRASDEP